MRRNDELRRKWILSDEHLWHWWLNSSHKSIKGFISKNREEIDRVINSRIEQSKRERK